MSLITGRHDGRRIFVDVALVGASLAAERAFAGEPDARTLSEPVKALVDTGATSTSISLHTAARIGLAAVGKRDVMTANGPRRSRVYNFQVAMLSTPSLNENVGAPPFFVLPHPVSGTELNHDGLAFDILLGMDVICQGDLIIRKNGSFSFEF